MSFNYKVISTRCTYCGYNQTYSSIEKTLGSKLKQYKFKYGLKDFETLSYKKYKCPGCESSDRERLYKLYIDTVDKNIINGEVLDFAPSICFSPYLKTKSAGYRSADLFIDGVDDKVDITNMEMYTDNKFSFINCSHILEHVNSDKRALQELYRVLKPGGRIILMTPIITIPGVYDEDVKETRISERWRRFAQDDHVRLYDRKTFLNRVRSAGFEIKEYGFWNLGVIKFIENGLRFKSKLYIVSKPKI